MLQLNHPADMQPEPDAAARIYQGASGQKYHEEKRALNPAALEWVMALRAEKFQRHVRAGDTVFEFGAGAGWNLGRLRSARNIGCDASAFLKERLTALGIEFVAESAAVPDETADVVICHHALEHLLESARALKGKSGVMANQNDFGISGNCRTRHSVRAVYCQVGAARAERHTLPLPMLF